MVKEKLIRDDVAGIVPAGKGGLVLSTTGRTPSGTSNFQIKLTNIDSASDPVLAVGNDESTRKDVALVKGHLEYQKLTKYIGAFGGKPWTDPAFLCTAANGRETQLESLDNHDDGHSWGYSSTAYIASSASSDSTIIQVIEPGAPKPSIIWVAGTILEMTISPSGSKVAWVGFDPKFASIGQELDRRTGAVLQQFKPARRLSQILYKGEQLYLVESEYGSNEARIVHAQAGQLKSEFAVQCRG